MEERPGKWSEGEDGKGCWKRGGGRRGEILSVKEEGSDGGNELGSNLDLDPDPWEILWIRIRLNDSDPLDPDPQLCLKVSR